MEMWETQDPHVLIEERRAGYTRYRNTADGRRWEVHGECVKLGYCIVGSVVNGREVKTLREARRIARELEFPIDSPVTPGFEGCCPFTFTELDPV